MSTFADHKKSTSANNQSDTGYLEQSLVDQELDPQYEGDFAFWPEKPESPAHLQGMNTFTTQNTKSANIDREIQEIARKIIAHEIDETMGRWEIIGKLVTDAKIPEYVARRAPNLTQQMRVDLAAELEDFLYEKAKSNRTMGLEKFLERSPSAWARTIARTAVQSKLRDLRVKWDRHYNVDPTLVSGAHDSEAHVDYASLSYIRASVTDGTDVDLEADRELNDIEDDFKAAAAGMRPSGVLRASARALLRTYKIPELVRPLSALERESIRGVIEENPELAKKTVAALLVRAGDLTTEQRGISRELYGLWANYTTSDLALLSKKPAAVAHTLAQAAVSPLPRPSRDQLAVALRTIRMADTGPEWRGLAKQLFDSWVAAEVEAISEFNTKSRKEDADTIASRLAAALAWPDLVSVVTALPGRPLGADEHEVSGFIASVVDSIRG